jgi:hypothetical protein
VVADIVSTWLRVSDDRTVSGTVDTADLSRGLNGSLAKRFLCILDEDLVEVCVVYFMQPDKSGEDIRGKVLQNVELVTC